jgi:phosphatidylglycerol lysyltransferase
VIYFWYKKQPYKGLNKGSIMIKLKLLAVSLLEWVSACILLYFIVYQYDKDISFMPVLVSFTLASIAGVASMLPGGAGSFDFVLLLGFKHYGMNVESALAALVMYRIFYYFMPLLIGIIITFSKQLLNGRKTKIKNEQLKNLITKTSNFTNLFLSFLVLISGIVLLASALVPGLVERLKIAYEILSLPIMHWSNQISICIGILLIFISKEIGMKVKRSYYATLFLLLIGAVSTFLKGFDFEEAIVLTFVFILLFFSKESFYRKSLPFNWLKTIFTVLLSFVGILTYVNIRHMILVDFLAAYRTTRVPGMIRFNSVFTGAVSYLSLIVFIIVWQLTKPRIEKDQRYESIDDEKLKAFLEHNKGNFLTHLIFLRDKHIFWAQNGNVAVVYEKSHNMIVVLGDPIGKDRLFGEGITEFLNFIDEYGYKAAFYQVSDTYLPMYHDLGYVFFKLGETALVNLSEFDLQGPESRSFRNVLSRFHKDEMEFQLMEYLPDELYDELKEVSDQWLGKRKEMGFSLGSFDRNYLKRSPLAVVKNCSTNEIMAFATVMPSYDGNKSVSLDLMRFKNNAPKNTMTFLILNLLISYKDKGYKIFNLGMVPLNNVGNRQRSHMPEKLAHQIMLYGRHIYSFAGLRSYKSKFSPSWEPRYMAYENIMWLPSSLIEATLLIR